MDPGRAGAMGVRSTRRPRGGTDAGQDIVSPFQLVCHGRRFLGSRLVRGVPADGHRDREKALLSEDSALAPRVNVDVYLEPVMLTGVVAASDPRRQAVEIARQAAPRSEIFDDLEAATGSGIADSATDFATNKELGLNLLADEGLASQSFQHRVVNGTAFIMGRAKDEGQIEKARQAALQTPGVVRVVTHILLQP